MNASAGTGEWLASFYAGINTKLQTQLFLSPIELEPMLQLAPEPSTDVVVLFVANKRDDSSGYVARNVVASQSFLWWGSTRQIAPFGSIDEVLECILERRLQSEVTTAHQRRIHDLQILDKLVAEAGNFIALWPITPERSVFVYIRRGDGNDDQTSLFFKLLAPYLDLYRASTVQTLNDTYKVRDEELGGLVSKMTSSPIDAARLCIEKVICHARFGKPECWLYEYRSISSKNDQWHRIHGVEHLHESVHLELLGLPETKRLMEANKVCGEALDSGQRMLLVPFRAPDVEYVSNTYGDPLVPKTLKLSESNVGLNLSSSGVSYRINAQRAGSERLVPGDLVIVVASGRPPHPNLLHTIASFRQLYFSVVLPRIKQAARNAVDERSNNIDGQLHPGKDDPSQPDLWQSFKTVCHETLPTFCEALRISIGINIYDVGSVALRRLYHVDHPGSLRNITQEDTEIIRLSGKRPGVVASTFLQRITPRERDVQVVPDVDKYDGYKRHRLTTASEYCSKLWFRSTPIGTINFESDCRFRFTEPIRRELDQLRTSLEQYIERFLSAQDARWLSISATSYHHLHELRGASEGWPAKYGNRVRDAIASFDAPPMKGSSSVGELQKYLNSLLTDYLENMPGPGREGMAKQLAKQCIFNVSGDHNEHKSLEIPIARFELLTRIVKNLSSNFFREGLNSTQGLFAIHLVHKPYVGIRIEQYQAGSQSEEWLRDAGYRPLGSAGTSDRTHHGLFLCGAISRFLDGFAWVGNRDGDSLRSVVSIVVPLQSQS